MAKFKPTPAQLENDPSLRWSPYLKGEALWSDDLQATVRFLAYRRGKIKLLTINSVLILGLFNENRVRRVSVQLNYTYSD